jgi:integrase
MIVMRFTGLRKQQVMRLTWDDVDMENALLTVRPELGKSKQERRGRVVPISAHLVTELAGWGVREGFLVKTRGEARRIDNPALHRAWRESGAPPEIWRQPCHAFRKGLISNLVGQGVAEHLVKALVGHARGVTGDVYTDTAAIMGVMREAVAKIPPIGAPVATTQIFGAGAAHQRAAARGR